MKIIDISFRDVDRKWVGITDNKSIKKIGKAFKYKGFISPIFGYCYIDKEYGLSIRIVGNIERDGKNKVYINEDFLNDDYDLGYDRMNKLNLDVTIIDDNISANIEGTKIIENKLEDNYKGLNKFIETRSYEYLDPFRDKKFPDDIEVINKDRETEEEETLWVTIEGLHDKMEDLLICRVSDDSKFGKLKNGDFVGVKYFEEEDACRVFGTLKRRENSNSD